jgi:hypothetical protein
MSKKSTSQLFPTEMVPSHAATKRNELYSCPPASSDSSSTSQKIAAAAERIGDQRAIPPEIKRFVAAESG